MLNTHRPFPVPQSEAADRFRPPCPIPDAPAAREDTAGFYAAVETVDRCVGRVLAALEASGHDKDTLVLFTTDHGPAFPGMKATLHDGGTGVALMIRLPADGGTAAEGFLTCDALVSQIDIFPTICELIGTPLPHKMQGLSLLPLLRGEQGELHSHLYTETTFHAASEPARAVRSRRYKLIRHYTDSEFRLPVNVDDSAVKDLFHKNGYFSEKVSREELFDLVLDPLERCNRLNDPRYSSVYQELKTALDEWMETTKDPLLGGPIDAPAGVRLNSSSSYSPDSGEFA
ncbi:MAG: sulfatase-like hydrolase/transferase [Spirochaetia bacterium]|nr:sulfatase-like hydrolase/transferase [Spirochaetia bacterium]